MTYYYTWIVVFAIISYVIVSDKNVADAFVYIFDITKNIVSRQIWWIKNNPQNPVVKYLMWRRSMKLAKELMDDLKSDAK